MDEEEVEPRVCFVLKRPLGSGGLQLQARSVISRLRAAGAECMVVAHARGAAGEARVREGGLPSVVLRARGSALFHLKLFLFLLSNRRRYDVIHVHGCGPEALVAAVGGALAGGKPLVVKPSTAGPGTRLGRWATAGRRLPWVEWLLRTGVWRWVAISERTARDLRHAGVPEERIAPIPNGVDTRRYLPLPARPRAELRARLGVAPGEVVVCAVARLTPHKRIDMLVRSVGSLARELGGLRLWVIGAGQERKRLEALAREVAPAGRIEFLGILPPPEVAERLQASDLYTACSQWEGLSNALLEAMACGVAPVSTRVSGGEDLLLDGENGRLVEPDDEPALRAALYDLAADAGARERLGAAARATVCAQFSLAETTERLTALYRLAATERERGRRPARRSKRAARALEG